ncbi:hypothetical protein IFM12275_40910 [Nocardia sputorum]|uniref:hypothetical protein n=1 Tax=Nocardia TaxID=1817 RepID=UPI002457637C|nr:MULTISPECIES: hypothetical protein [Nocardia]BDT94115.1 hypothetical protein IFM12275_40910 [Nocardia sputorum]
MVSNEVLPARGAVFWPVGTGDSTTIVVDESVVLQIDLHDLAKAQDDDNPEVAVVDRLVEALPLVEDRPYLATFALTHADKDHCLGFADLLEKARIGELWSTPRLWREFNDPDAPELCDDAVAFREESERRVKATMDAVAKGTEPASGDRILVVGYDDDHSKHAYDELPEVYKSGPGKSVTELDGHECGGKFEAFFHAPFRDDCAAARNDTSLAMQVTLTDESGEDAKLLLFGDLAHDTIMKIFDYSEYHKREKYLEWDFLLAPHHCSKKVMYKPGDSGDDVLQMDILNAFERHMRDGGVVVSSSGVIPEADVSGANPPHRKAANRYSEISDDVICTMSWVDEDAPSPVVLGVDASGPSVVREAEIKSASRLRTLTAAAASLASVLASPGHDRFVSGPDRVDQAVASDRGGENAPDTAVGFGN